MSYAVPTQAPVPSEVAGNRESYNNKGGGTRRSYGKMGFDGPQRKGAAKNREAGQKAMPWKWWHGDPTQRHKDKTLGEFVVLNF